MEKISTIPKDNSIDSVISLDYDTFMMEKFNYKYNAQMIKRCLFGTSTDKSHSNQITREDFKSAIDYIIDNKNKVSKKVLDQLIATLIAKYVEIEIDQLMEQKIDKIFYKKIHEYNYY